MPQHPNPDPAEPASSSKSSPKTGGGWFSVARSDQRKILTIPTTRAALCFVVWAELLQYSNFKKSLSFSLSQVTISMRTGIGRRTVFRCLQDLVDAKLLAYSAPRTKGGGNESSRFTLKPSESPFRAPPHAHPATTPPCSPEVRLQMSTLKHLGVEDSSQMNKKEGFKKEPANPIHTSGGGGTAAGGSVAAPKREGRSAPFLSGSRP